MPETPNNLTTLTTPKQLWKDHYPVKKPRCAGCIKQNIPEEEYKFCSLEKEPITIMDERGQKVVKVFENIYQCQVYHWTIYQGKVYSIKNKAN